MRLLHVGAVGSLLPTTPGEEDVFLKRRTHVGVGVLWSSKFVVTFLGWELFLFDFGEVVVCCLSIWILKEVIRFW